MARKKQDLRAAGAEMARRGRRGEQPLGEQAKAVRSRQAKGEKLTRHETGILGAEASVRKTKQQAAKKPEKYEVESWTNDPESARTPHMTQRGTQRAAAAKRTKASGKKLTREESGTLGGAKRVGKKKGRSVYGEKARGFLSEEIRHHVQDQGMPQSQAVAVAMSEARRKGLKVPAEEPGRAARETAKEQGHPAKAARMRREEKTRHRES